MWVVAVDERTDRAIRSGTEVKVPRRMDWRVVPKKNSTMFSHDALVEVKCMVIRGSVENLNVCARCGCRRRARQIRATSAKLIGVPAFVR